MDLSKLTPEQLVKLREDALTILKTHIHIVKYVTSDIWGTLPSLVMKIYNRIRGGANYILDTDFRDPMLIYIIEQLSKMDENLVKNGLVQFKVVEKHVYTYLNNYPTDPIPSLPDNHETLFYEALEEFSPDIKHLMIKL